MRKQRHSRATHAGNRWMRGRCISPDRSWDWKRQRFWTIGNRSGRRNGNLLGNIITMLNYSPPRNCKFCRGQKSFTYTLTNFNACHLFLQFTDAKILPQAYTRQRWSPHSHLWLEETGSAAAALLLPLARLWSAAERGPEAPSPSSCGLASE